MAKSKKTKSRSESDDYPAEAYGYLFNIEPKHFWFKGRNNIIESVLKEEINEINKKTFLEVGCGTGFVLSSLEKLGFSVTGLDMHRRCLKYAKKRTKAPILCKRIEKLSTKKKFDVVGAFDVLEHVENQNDFIKKCKAVLKKEGSLVVTVPARKELWSKIDDFSKHKRRYDKKSLVNLFKRNGFKVRKVDYFGFFVFLPQWLLRKYQSIKMGKIDKKNTVAFFKETIQIPPLLINEFIRLLFFIESIMIKYVSFPIGGSLILVAEKNK